MAALPVRVVALLCALYVAHSAQRRPSVDAVDRTSTDIEKRSTAYEEKRGLRPDLGKRYDVDDVDDEGDESLRQSLSLLTDRQTRSRGRFRGDLGKRRSSFRGDLGKRRFRGDLGKRADDDDDGGDVDGGDRLTAELSAAEKRPRGSSFRGDLGKRRSSFRGDLGKRDAAPSYDSWTTWSDGDDDERGRADVSRRRYGFRGDLGKRRASFRGDLGK